MIVTIGTNDTLASPGAQLDYYQSVLDRYPRYRKGNQTSASAYECAAAEAR